MTMMSWWAIPVAIGLVLAGLVVGLLVARRRRPQGGTPLANTSRFLALASFGRVVRRHAVVQGLTGLTVLVMAVGATMVAVRPAESETLTTELASRDVVLCLDVSGSMIEVDADLMSVFEDLVKEFDGERVGLSVFDSSSVTLFPLTDDYEFLADQLGLYAEQLESWDWESGFDYSGTMLGYEYGSSLIGDGLAMCLDLFDHTDQERARAVVLATDNYLSGAPYLTLEQAATLAKMSNIRVYGIDPGWASYYGYGGDTVEAEQMREACELTGGEYYTMDDGGTVRKIANAILKEEAALIESDPYLVVYDRSGRGVAVMAVGLAGLVLVQAATVLAGRGRRRSL